MRLNLTADEVLTTTRSVRSRLDVERPVLRAVIEECLEIAFQAPNGSNLNSWRWVVVDDRGLVGKLADIYNAGMEDEIKRLSTNTARAEARRSVPRGENMRVSVEALRHKMAQMPSLVVPLMAGRPETMDAFEQASAWGSILQAVWSFFLALRIRGLSSAWTTVSIHREKDVADLLGIPMEQYTQAGLFPVAYTIGTEFKPGWRKPLAEVVSFNRFGRS